MAGVGAARASGDARFVAMRSMRTSRSRFRFAPALWALVALLFWPGNALAARAHRGQSVRVRGAGAAGPVIIR